MLENADATIKGVVNGGADDDGSTIYFDLKFDSGLVRRFRCPHQRLGHVVSTLHALVGAAVICGRHPVESRISRPVCASRQGRQPAF